MKIFLILISVSIVFAPIYSIIEIAVQTIPPFVMVGLKSRFSNLMLFVRGKINSIKLSKEIKNIHEE